MTKSSNLFVRKPIDLITAQAQDSEHKLNKVLSAKSLIALGIGVIVGAGLFYVTGIVAGNHAGPAVLISFLIAALGCLFAGMCYAELASMIPVAGSAYTYAYATLGELIAWIIGWDLVLEYALGAAAVSASWAGYAASFLADLGLHLPPRLTLCPFETIKIAPDQTLHGIVNLPAVFIVITLSILLIRGIRESSLVNNIIVVIKLSVIFLFIAVGLAYINTDNFAPFIPQNTGTFGEFGWSGIFRGAGVIFFAYIGFDVVSTTAQEAHNPARNIPIGVIGSLLACTLIYIAFAFVLTGMVNYTLLKDNPAPVATAINLTPFHWLHLLIKLGIIAGFTSVILVLLLGQSRIFYSMSRDGLLPKIFSDIHPVWHTPWRSNILFMIFVSLLAGFVPIVNLSHMTSIGTLFAFVIVCAAVLILRVVHPDWPRVYKVPFAPAIPIAGIIVCLLLMISLPSETWTRLLIWLAIGIIIYFAYSRHHSKFAKHQRENPSPY